MAAVDCPRPTPRARDVISKRRWKCATSSPKARLGNWREGQPVSRSGSGVHRTGGQRHGRGKKFQYDIWGDTVITASRVKSNGEVGHVNISGGDVFTGEERSPADKSSGVDPRVDQ
ncbi:MAG: hypothetical protein IPJ85_18070 [Flavobacteriales bacterium]|nr:hypothetical protein [Flavobacteriales bacterium]